MMNPGSNYMMMKMRHAISTLEKENKELKALVEELKAQGAKPKPKKFEVDEAPKAKPVVKKLELEDEPAAETKE
jgi:uncharacterized membrane protein